MESVGRSLGKEDNDRCVSGTGERVKWLVQLPSILVLAIRAVGACSEKFLSKNLRRGRIGAHKPIQASAVGILGTYPILAWVLGFWSRLQI